MGALTARVELPGSFVQRASEKWQTTLLTILRNLGYSELPVTLSYVKQRCMIAGEDWAFAEDILKPDPNESPTVPELPNRSWLAQY